MGKASGVAWRATKRRHQLCVSHGQVWSSVVSDLDSPPHHHVREADVVEHCHLAGGHTRVQPLLVKLYVLHHAQGLVVVTCWIAKHKKSCLARTRERRKCGRECQLPFARDVCS